MRAVGPAWSPPHSSDVSFEPMPLVLFDRLAIHRADGSDAPGPADALSSPTMLVHPMHLDMVLVSHHRGVHLLHLPWLADLQYYCVEGRAKTPSSSSAPSSSSLDLPSLPRSSATSLVEYIPPPSSRAVRAAMSPVSVLGMRVMCDPSVGHFLVVMTQNHEVIVSDMELYGRGVSIFSPALSKVEGVSNMYKSVKPFKELIDPILSRRPKPFPTMAASPHLKMETAESLDLLIEKCHCMQQNYILYITALREEVNNRVQLVDTLIVQQDADVDVVRKSLAKEKANTQALREKIKLVSDFQSMLSNRANLLLGVINSNQQSLSTAEIHFHKELKQKERLVSVEYKERIAEVGRQINDFSAVRLESGGGKGGGLLTRKQMNKIKPVLEEEQALIEETINGLKQVSLALGSS
eukprot:TRINITY_DN7613_c0_g1_i1.p1 TRINITY_DN7613_c0_g1~~TRINITY_DN7613_c0_g1_i1.p1  ORF type:complete len:409 (+),score=98.95 TRINITY_DN7613_c0_g1_i1:302-1528(+)